MITNIRLTYRDLHSNKRHVQSISSISASTPVDDLRQICLDKFVHCISSSICQKGQKPKVGLFVGFPPKLLEEEVGTTSPSTIGDCGITSQMNIMVQFSVPQNTREAQEEEEEDGNITLKSKEGNTASATAETTSNTVSIITSDRPSRRAAAIAATETFQEAEKAIRRLQKREEEERTKRKSKQSTKTKSSTTSKNTTSLRTNNQFTACIGDGRTLSTGHIVPNRNNTTTKKKSSKETSSMLFQNEEDVTDALLSSVLNKNTSNGKVLSMILRKGMKNAVAKSYESSRANIRLNAYLQKQYTMTSSSSDPNTATSSPLQQYHVGSFDISYSKGLEGRGTYTDTIEILTKETLEAVIRTVYSNSIKSATEDEDMETEEEISMLNPIYMSQASSRVFWSSAYHYPDHTSIEES